MRFLLINLLAITCASSAFCGTNEIAAPECLSHLFNKIALTVTHHEYFASYELKEKGSQSNVIAQLLQLAATNDTANCGLAVFESDRGPFYPLRNKDMNALLLAALLNDPLKMFAFDTYIVRDKKIADLLRRRDSYIHAAK